jgi:hypothetical protein
VTRSPKKHAGPALRVWNAHGGLPRARIVPGQEPRLRLDGGLLVRVRHCERLHAAAARTVLREPRDGGEPLVVTADRSTVVGRRLLQEGGAGVVDGAGRARVRLPGLVVHTDPAPPPRVPADGPPAFPDRGPDGRPRRVRLRGRTGLVGHALLLWPGADWQVQDLAARCGLSPSPVHFALRRLEALGAVETEGRGPGKTRRLVAREALLDLLVAEHEDRGTERVSVHRAPAADGRPVAEDVARALHGAGVPHAVTGGAAFARLVGAPPPGVTAVWVAGETPLTELGDGLGADPTRGPANVELRRARDASPLAFGRVRDGVRLANHIRVYLDLLADPGHDPGHADVLRHALVGQ